MRMSALNRALVSWVVTACLGSASPLFAQEAAAGTPTQEQNSPLPAFALALGLGTLQEPFTRGVDSGILKSISFQIFPRPKPWLAFEFSVSSTVVGVQPGVSLLLRSAPRRVVWFGGGGPLFGVIPSGIPAGPGNLAIGETAVFLQLQTGVEASVTRRMAAFGRLHLNSSGADYGNIWIVGGLRVVIFDEGRPHPLIRSPKTLRLSS